MLFAITGILLNHGIVGSSEQRVFQMPVPQAGLASEDEFVAWFMQEFGISRLYIPHESATYEEKTGERVPLTPAKSMVVNGRTISQPEVWQARSRTPTIDLRVKYRPGDAFATAQRDARGFVAIFNQLHLQNGTNVWFVLLTDTAAGALIMLSITGLMLWSGLHGSRLVALLLLLVPTLLAVVFAFILGSTRR